MGPDPVDCCPFRKRKSRQAGRYSRETQREAGHLQTKARSLRRNQRGLHLELRLGASKTVRKQIPVVQATQSVALCYGSPGGLLH